MSDPVYAQAFVSAFRDLFDGQREFYAEESVPCVVEPISDERIRDHLEGRRRLGIYAMAGRERDHCRWIVADVQGPDWELALALERRLEDGHGIKAHIERSKSGGWHVWVFFAAWVRCWKARAAIGLAIADIRDRAIHPIEIIPDQNQIPAEPADLRGRYVWLPLFGRDVATGRTCFYVDVAGRPVLVKDWTPTRVASNREIALDHLLDGMDESERATAYARGDDEAPSERRVDALLPCATRVLKDGARDDAVPEWAKRLAIHLRRNGYREEQTLATLKPWNQRLCVPELDGEALRSIVAATYDPANAKEGLGCDHPLVVPCCAKGECPVWRVAHLAPAEAARPKIDPKRVVMDKDDAATMSFWFSRGELKYRVLNLDNSRGAMRCLLIIEKDGETVWKQAANLDSTRSRTEVEKKVFERCKIGDVSTDLMNISDGIMKRLEETVRKDRTKAESARQGYVLTEQETRAVQQWAREHPRILYDVIEYTSRHGLIREFANRLLVYLLGTSRKMKSPFSGIGKGDAASGKSFLASAIFKLMPEEDLVEYTRITSAALYYRDEYALQNKIFFVREAPGADGSEHSIRTFMTEGDLTQSTVQKDESGRNVSVDMKIRGPIAFYTTTTLVEINPENETRLLQVHADETREMNEAILKPIAWAAQHGSLDPSPDTLLAWRNFQRVLVKGAGVVVPFAKRLMSGFPTSNLRSRRDFARLLDLIKACAYLHQFHRQKHTYVDDAGQPHDDIVASVADYAIVKRVVGASMMKSALDVKAGQEELIKAVNAITETAILEAKSGRTPLQHTEAERDGNGDWTVWIATPAIREYLGKTQRAVRDLVRTLEEQGIVIVAPNRKPTRLRIGDRVVNGELVLPTIDPEELFADAPQDRALAYDPLTAPDFDQIHRFDAPS